MRENGTALSAWDRGEFWQHILAVNPQVRPATRAFLTMWFSRVCSLEVDRASDDEVLRQLIGRRERTQKGGQFRLTNDRLLGAGPAGRVFAA